MANMNHRLAPHVASMASDNQIPVHLRMRRVREGRCISTFYTVAGGGVAKPHSEQTPLVLPVRS